MVARGFRRFVVAAVCLLLLGTTVVVAYGREPREVAAASARPPRVGGAAPAGPTSGPDADGTATPVPPAPSSPAGTPSRTVGAVSPPPATPPTTRSSSGDPSTTPGPTGGPSPMPIPSPTPIPSPSPTPTPAPEPPRTATIAFTGDIIPHRPVMAAAAAMADSGWDFRPMFAGVRPVLADADLALCHLETPISADDSDLGTYPMFNAPRALAAAIADAGYEGCSTASNHSFDRRADGVRATIDAFESQGLQQAGMARSAEHDLEPVLYDANGITVGHIAATYWLNGFELPDDQPWLVDLIEPDEILREARLARAAGAEFVVVSLHWGNQYQHEPTPDQERWATELLPSPEVDLLVGHHAHVVQPVDRMAGEWVVFGLGNFLSNQFAECCGVGTQDGMVATVTLREDEPGSITVAGVDVVPTWVDRAGGYVIRPATAGEDLPDLATALADAAARTRAVVGSRVGPDDGLTFAGP